MQNRIENYVFWPVLAVISILRLSEACEGVVVVCCGAGGGFEPVVWEISDVMVMVKVVVSG
jgi:hypothetical protein